MGFIDWLANFFYRYTDYIIMIVFVVGVVVFFTMLIMEKMFKNKAFDSIGHKNKVTDNKTFNNGASFSNTKQYLYNVFDLCIDVLPLLGTLGTVVGLLCIRDDVASMQSSFVVALRTTFEGLLGCIVLKLLDTLVIGYFDLKNQREQEGNNDKKDE